MIKIENIYTHIKSFCTLLVIHISYSGRCCFRQEGPGDDICVQGRRWDGVPAPTTVKQDKRATALGGAHLKHCSRSPWAKRPAWYSSPSITEGTVSVSCTMTAISLSRFPSMLRSFMLAEPIMGNSDVEQPSWQRVLLVAFPAQFFLPKKTLILFRLSRNAEFWEGEARHNPGISLDQSKPATVIL